MFEQKKYEDVTSLSSSALGGDELLGVSPAESPETKGTSSQFYLHMTIMLPCVLFSTRNYAGACDGSVVIVLMRDFDNAFIISLASRVRVGTKPGFARA